MDNLSLGVKEAGRLSFVVRRSSFVAAAIRPVAPFGHPFAAPPTPLWSDRRWRTLRRCWGFSSSATSGLSWGCAGEWGDG